MGCRVGPDPVMGVLIKEIRGRCRQRNEDTQEKGHMMTETEIGVMHSQAKECQ